MGPGMESQYLMGTELQLKKFRQKILEMDGADGHVTMRVYLMPENCTNG